MGQDLAAVSGCSPRNLVGTENSISVGIVIALPPANPSAHAALYFTFSPAWFFFWLSLTFSNHQSISATASLQGDIYCATAYSSGKEGKCSRQPGDHFLRLSLEVDIPYAPLSWRSLKSPLFWHMHFCNFPGMPTCHLGHETKLTKVKWVSPLSLDPDPDRVQRSVGSRRAGSGSPLTHAVFLLSLSLPQTSYWLKSKTYLFRSNHRSAQELAWDGSLQSPAQPRKWFLSFSSVRSGNGGTGIT